MSVRVRLAIAFIAAVLVWVMAVEPGPVNPWVGLGLLGILGILAVTEQRLKPSRRRNIRG